jgi:hypothetical protein
VHRTLFCLPAIGCCAGPVLPALPVINQLPHSPPRKSAAPLKKPWTSFPHPLTEGSSGCNFLCCKLRKSAAPLSQIRRAGSARPAFPAAVLAAASPPDPAPATPADGRLRHQIVRMEGPPPPRRSRKSAAQVQLGPHSPPPSSRPHRPRTPRQQRPRMEGCATKSRGWKVHLLLLLSPNRASAAPSNPAGVQLYLGSGCARGWKVPDLFSPLPRPPRQFPSLLAILSEHPLPFMDGSRFHPLGSWTANLYLFKNP